MLSFVGKYRLLGELGRGGMAVVYKAEDTSLGRVVALKVLPEHLSGDAQFIARLRSEARSAAALEHPNVVSIYEVGQEGDTHYIAMRYVEGMTLAEMIRERGALDLDTVTRIGEQVASALDYAHSRGIVHRDIKPGNIMVDGEGRAYVSDFGIARAAGGTRVTATGATIGTPEYMSPEQAMGKQVDERTDIYSFGIVLYEMLTGRVPFQADTPIGVGMKHIHDTPPSPRSINPGLLRNVEEAILSCLAKLPEARPRSAKEVVEGLKGTIPVAASYAPPVLISSSPTATPPVPDYSVALPRMGPSRTGLVIGLFVFLGLVLVGTLVYYAACPPYAVRPKGVKVPPPVSRPLPPIPSVPDGSAVKPPPGEKGQPAPEPGIRPEQEERIRTDVEATVKNWLDAWRNGNVDTYMSFYAPDVLGETEVGRPPLNRGQWRIYKLGLFEKYHSIVIEVVGSIAVTVDPVKPNEAKVTYSQRFRGDSKYSDYGEKSLTLHCTNGEWRIVRESWRKLP